MKLKLYKRKGRTMAYRTRRKRRRRNPVRRVLKRNPMRARRRRRVYRPRRKIFRRNPSYFAPALRSNPVKRRRRTRKNPNGTFRRVMSQRWLMSVASIGVGIAAGYYTTPLVYGIIPAANREQFRPFMGGLNILAGSLLISFAPRRRGGKMMKEIGAIVAGMGVYDLVAENVPQLGLPPIPKTNPIVSGLPGMSASYTVSHKPVSRVASSVGQSYAYAPVNYGASYSAPGAETAGLGSDDPFAGIWS